MKKELKYIIFIVIGFIAILWLAKPLSEFFGNYNINELNAKLIAGNITRLFIIIIGFWIIGKLKLKKYNGIEKGEKIQNLHALIIPSLFILMGLMGSWNTYINADKTSLLLFTASVFIVGLTEELLFRGTIVPLFISYFKNQKAVLYFSVIAASLIFGTTHYINLFKQPDNFWGITHQVFFAVSIGVFFGGLMLRTKNIIIPSLFHGFVNFSFGAGELKQEDMHIIKEEATNGINWSSLILTSLFFVFIFISGIFMIKKANKQLILNKLN